VEKNSVVSVMHDFTYSFRKHVQTFLLQYFAIFITGIQKQKVYKLSTNFSNVWTFVEKTSIIEERKESITYENSLRFNTNFK